MYGTESIFEVLLQLNPKTPLLGLDCLTQACHYTRSALQQKGLGLDGHNYSEAMGGGHSIGMFLSRSVFTPELSQFNQDFHPRHIVYSRLKSWRIFREENLTTSFSFAAGVTTSSEANTTQPESVTT